MIAKETIEKIIETARVDEVVGDFVQLKKRGTSLIGLCPFHNEKTPSFNVSVTKGIYKCFGCGKGGDSLQFIMDHEKYSYPEALKYLADKYHIEIEETVQSPEQLIADTKRESLYIITAWAGKFFQHSMWDTDEGKTIGLSYFKERGFRDDVIKKFELGYSPDEWDALTQKAISESYNQEFLEESGLTIRNDKGKLYDRFRGRVMFPIHNFTGRVIGFGGRTLKNDKNVPKYVNSPESEIYHKSNVLYGLFHAKKTIRDEDNCFLVEGYADVLSVHQAGIENVVASSGTSLTIEQIRLIGRFTKNVTILYDGDEAGIKASLRGLDMILEEGLNVKVVLFPDKHDPDSYVQQVGSSAFKTYIEQHKRDFILYKTTILLKDAGTDPIKRAGVIREVVESIAKIPDSIKASVFAKECSSLMQIEERVLISELNKMLLNKQKKASEKVYQSEIEEANNQNDKPTDTLVESDDTQEKQIVRLLLTYGNEIVNWEGITDTYIAPYIISNISDVVFDNIICGKIVDAYRKGIEEGYIPLQQDFIRNSDSDIAQLAISVLSSPYVLNDWEGRRKIVVHDERYIFRETIVRSIFHLKRRKLYHIDKDIMEQLKLETDEDNVNILLSRKMRIKEVEKEIAKHLGIVIN